jgi:membrane-associated phospholipid phosphatase
MTGLFHNYLRSFFEAIGIDQYKIYYKLYRKMNCAVFRILGLLWLTVTVDHAILSQVDSPYNLSLGRELLYAGSGSATNLTGIFLSSNIRVTTVSDLHFKKVNGLDRIAIGLNSGHAGNLSDVTLYASMGLPLVLLTGKKMREQFPKILLLFGETILINQGLTDIIKSTSLRPRPYVHSENFDPASILSSNDRASFLSGHTSASAAASFFVARVFSDYYPDSKLKPWVWSMAAGIPGLTGYLRVKSGKHYPTDVLAGYVLGAGVGVLVPALHRKPMSSRNVTWIAGARGVLVKYRFQ